MAYPEDFDGIMLGSKAEFRALEPRVQIACCLHRLEAEVNNGGFHQFFANSGEYLPETLHALSAIEATATRALLERAAAVAFPDGYPVNPGGYENALADFDAVADELEPLDSEFYAYAEPLADLVNRYFSLGT
jgi:hypothetical protein